MEQWKLPELRQSVGYQLHVPGGNPFQQTTGVSHELTSTSTPSSSDAKRNANTSSLARLDSRLRNVAIKNYRIHKSRFQARLDYLEGKNTSLTVRLSELKQYDKYMVKLSVLQTKIMEAETKNKQLETEVRNRQIWVDLYGLEGQLKGGEEEEDEEDEEEEEESEEESEEEEENEEENEEEDEEENEEDNDEDEIEEEED